MNLGRWRGLIACHVLSHCLQDGHKTLCEEMLSPSQIFWGQENILYQTIIFLGQENIYFTRQIIISLGPFGSMEGYRGKGMLGCRKPQSHFFDIIFILVM